MSDATGISGLQLRSLIGKDGTLEPAVARYRKNDLRRHFRADAAFANPEVYEFLEAEGYKCAIRLPARRILQGRVGYLLKRPVDRPPITVGANAVRHARYAIFQMAEVAVQRELFEQILRLIDGLRRRPAPAQN